MSLLPLKVRKAAIRQSERAAAAQTLEASTPSQPVEANPVAAKQSQNLVLEPKKLTIACQERTWVKIVIDGAEQKEFMLNPEEVVTLTHKRTLTSLSATQGE